MADISERIKRAMDLRGLGFNEVDRKLGYSEGYTSRTIKSGRKPRADTVRRFAEILEVSAEWLITGKGEPTAFSSAPRVTKEERYPNLRVALDCHASKWSPAVIAAAREMRLDADEDPSPKWWAEQLDRLEAAIGGATMKVGEPLEGDPVADTRGARGTRKTRR